MIEYLMLIGIGMLLVTIVTAIVISESGDASEDRHEHAVREQYERVRSELLAATLAVDGYSTQLLFEPPYRGVLMNLTIEGSGIAVRSAKASSGGIVPGVNASIETSTALLTIEKSGDEVRVT